MTPRNMTSDLTPEPVSVKQRAIKREPEVSPKSRPEKRFKQSVPHEVKEEPEPEIEDFSESKFFVFRIGTNFRHYELILVNNTAVVILLRHKKYRSLYSDYFLPLPSGLAPIL